MKIIVKDVAYKVDLDWTFNEEDAVRRVTGVGYTEAVEAAAKGDGRGARALAVVAYLRVGKDLAELHDGSLKLSDFVIDLLDESEDDPGPLAEDGQSVPGNDEKPEQES